MKWLPVVLLLLISCNPVKKATQVMKDHPDKLAELCAEEFPPVIVSDSTAFLESKKKIDSLISSFESEKQLSDEERQALFETIDWLNRQPIPDCDSLSDAVYRLAAKEKQRADKLQDLNHQLRTEVNNIKPVIEKVSDKAMETVLRNQVNDLIGTVTHRDQTISQLEPWKGKAKKRWWIMIGVIAAAGLWTFRKPLLKLV